eukprot:gb/GECG01009587.1/.p1 GENE.gb/GECG01009587.1/~~gb/GECG01009587.1/.p1  ORF type:complete len:1366 (+),score=207.69 gb/GECG01009587.1/:1-4098(+)
MHKSGSNSRRGSGRKDSGARPSSDSGGTSERSGDVSLPPIQGGGQTTPGATAQGSGRRSGGIVSPHTDRSNSSARQKQGNGQTKTGDEPQTSSLNGGKGEQQLLESFKPILGELFSITRSQQIPYKKPRRNSAMGYAWGPDSKTTSEAEAVRSSQAKESPPSLGGSQRHTPKERPTSAPFAGESGRDSGSSESYSNEQVFGWLKEGDGIDKLVNQVSNTVKELQYYKTLVKSLPKLLQNISGNASPNDDNSSVESLLTMLTDTASELLDSNDVKQMTELFGFNGNSKEVISMNSKENSENIMAYLSLDSGATENEAVGHKAPPVEDSSKTAEAQKNPQIADESQGTTTGAATGSPGTGTHVAAASSESPTTSTQQSSSTTTTVTTSASQSAAVQLFEDTTEKTVESAGIKEIRDDELWQKSIHPKVYGDMTHWNFPKELHPVGSFALCLAMAANSPRVVQDVVSQQQEMASKELPPLFSASDSGERWERSIASFPLCWSDSGLTNLALTCATSKPGFFESVHVDTLQTLASIGAMALKSSQMFKAGQNAKRQADLLLQMVQSVIKGDNVRDIIGRIIDVAYELLQTARVSVFLVDWEAEELVLSVSQDAAGLRIPIDKGIAGTVASTGQVLNIPDAYEDPRFDRGFDQKTGFRTKSILAMPVRSQDGKSVVAVVQAINKLSGECFTNADIRMMAAVTDTAGVTLHKARLLQEANVARKQNEALVDVVKIVRNPSAGDNLEVILDRLTEVAYSLIDADLIVLFVLDELRKELRGKKYDTSKLKARAEQAANQYDLGQGLSSDKMSPKAASETDDSGLENAPYEELVVPLGKGIAGKVAAAQDSETIISRKAREHPFYDENYDHLNNLADTGLLCMPLNRPDAGASHSRPVAVLQAVHKRDGSPFSSTDMKLLEAFGAEVAHVIAENSYSIAYERALQGDGDQGSTGADESANIQSFLTQFTRKNQGYANKDEELAESSDTSLQKAPSTSSSAAANDPSTAPETPKEAIELPEEMLNHQPRQDMGEKMTCWDFNVLEYSPQELQLCCVDMLHYTGLLQRFNLPIPKLMRFISKIANRYQDNPYHNWYHGASVVHVSFVILQASRPVQDALSMLHRLALLLSAICHDVDHPGLNNGYHANTFHPLALTYNDNSVLENHHAAIMFHTLRDEKSQTNALATLSRPEFKEFRRISINAILSTDMVHHMDMVNSIKMLPSDIPTAFGTAGSKTKASGTPEGTHAKQSPEEPTATKLKIKFSLVDLILHSADLCNPVLPDFNVVKQWAYKVCKEFDNQAKLEKAAGLEPAPFMTNLDTEGAIAKNQLGFLDYVCKPLWEAMADLVPEISSVRENLQNNRTQWKEIVDTQAASN